VTLLRPRWVAGHLLVLVLSAAFIALGFWQLSRNHHKQSLVRAARAAYAAPAPDVTRNPVTAPLGNRVQLSGRYDPAHSVLLRNRVHGGKDGNDILTPLLLDDGSGVIVDRGWVAAVGDGRAPVTTVTPTGPVVVRGILHPSSTLSAQDTVTSSGGQLALPRVDTGRINLALSYQLLPRWVEAQSQTPPPEAGAPALPQPPPPDQVNHMQYAIQWFSFAAISVIGWPVALISIARRRGGFSTPDRGDERDHGED
jgi:cytochrome oxidase assembly protein ShyY1